MARRHLGVGFRPEIGRRRAGRRLLLGGKMQFEQACPAGIAEQPHGELPVLKQGGLRGQAAGPHHQHSRGLLLHELRNLQHADAQERIEQDRHDGDHEERPPIAHLVANFPPQNQLDVAESHRAAAKPQAASCWEIN